ncbi:MAG TPA: methyltransferase domain-containing protein [Actinocatenispora sp.]
MTGQMTQQSAAEELSGRIFTAGVAAAELYGVYLGLTLGLYRVLADRPGLTGAALAEATGLDRRYVREWVQGQAVSGFVLASGTDLDTATFALPPGGRDVLVDEVSPYYLAPLAQMPAAVGQALPTLTQAFRTGAGVPLPAYGPDGVTAQAALNRPGYHHELADSWIAAMPDVAARLADTTRPARVADLGCGGGWAAIALATRYPHVHVDGYDVDEASVEFARHNVADAGVADRVTVTVHDLADPLPGAAGYDLVLLMECVHDMAFPARTLATARGGVADGGAVLVMDEATDDELVAPTDDPVQRFFANVSPIWCLPQGRTEPDADPVGTVIRASRMAELAAEAGFRSTEVLPIDNPFFRFYRLHA